MSKNTLFVGVVQVFLILGLTSSVYAQEWYIYHDTVSDFEVELFLDLITNNPDCLLETYIEEKYWILYGSTLYNAIQDQGIVDLTTEEYSGLIFILREEGAEEKEGAVKAALKSMEEEQKSMEISQNIPIWTPEKYHNIITNHKMEIDYSQSQPGEFMATYWTVYSDRANNFTYKTPGGAKYKTIFFLEEFWVIEEEGEWLHIGSRFLPKYWEKFYEGHSSSKSVDFGWIHKSKLILSKQCLRTEKGKIERKALLINTVERLQDKTDFGDLEIVNFKNQPTDIQKKEYLTGYSSMLHEFFYILKSESYNGKEYYLLSQNPTVPLAQEKREAIIVGWAPVSRLTFWNTRVALEPNWEKEAIKERRRGKRVKFFHTKLDARNYKNGKKVDKDNVYWSEEIVAWRLDGELWRFPLLREDKNDPDIITSVVMGMVKIDSVDIPLARKATTTLNINGQQYPLLRKVILMDKRALSQTLDQIMDLLQTTTKAIIRDEIYNVWLMTLAVILGENKNMIEDYSFEEINIKLYGFPNIATYLSKENISIQDIKDPTVFTAEKLSRYLHHMEVVAEELNDRLQEGKDHKTAFVSNDVIYFWVEVELLP